ncbi:hypothetical protein SKAU_G00027060 [Synaphobranchus kaupii]|uniref:Uncharacterized protein n=1 Tax=Synaphobranchus kaupii TaxID=118154 RepID=A0A9Q1JDP8_SYNKA|nr:hypothetical protein SKAU_G00027060 [Synaphobranchus kaupii]
MAGRHTAGFNMAATQHDSTGGGNIDPRCDIISCILSRLPPAPRGENQTAAVNVASAERRKTKANRQPLKTMTMRDREREGPSKAVRR